MSTATGHANSPPSAAAVYFMKEDNHLPANIQVDVVELRQTLEGSECEPNCIDADDFVLGTICSHHMLESEFRRHSGEFNLGTNLAVENAKPKLEGFMCPGHQTGQRTTSHNMTYGRRG
jgi:hypothetical protein